MGEFFPHVRMKTPLWTKPISHNFEIHLYLHENRGANLVPESCRMLVPESCRQGLVPD
jgi:hypothetical protein